MGKIFVFCRIKLKFCSWLHKKRWHTFWKFQLEIKVKKKLSSKTLWQTYMKWTVDLLLPVEGLKLSKSIKYTSYHNIDLSRRNPMVWPMIWVVLPWLRIDLDRHRMPLFPVRYYSCVTPDIFRKDAPRTPTLWLLIYMHQQTETAVFTLPLHFLLPEDRTIRINY